MQTLHQNRKQLEDTQSLISKGGNFSLIAAALLCFNYGWILIPFILVIIGLFLRKHSQQVSHEENWKI